MLIGILCKTFLQYLSKFIESPVFLGIWKKTLNYIEMYMKAGKSDLLVCFICDSSFIKTNLNSK
jgi:hypothetical protein